jgi:hypothetical protein
MVKEFVSVRIKNLLYILAQRVDPIRITLVKRIRKLKEFLFSGFVFYLNYAQHMGAKLKVPRAFHNSCLTGGM